MNQQLHTTETEERNALPLLPRDIHEELQAQQMASLAEETVTSDSATLTALIQAEVRQKRRDDYIAIAWSAVFTVSAVYLARGTAFDYATLKLRLLTFVLLMTFIGAVMCLHLARRSYRRKRSLTQELTKTHDITHIGPLIDTLRVENTNVRNLSKQALIDLLPALQTSDAPLLTDTHRDVLLRQLAISPKDHGYRDLKELFSRSAYQREVDLRVSILKALEQVGGAKELPAVERLSRGLPSVRSTSFVPSEVRTAAQECLSYLQIRASEQRASEQLLRASGINSAPTDTLLRPVESRPDADPQSLLRASKGDTS